jgi:hypothetical protein
MVLMHIHLTVTMTGDDGVAHTDERDVRAVLVGLEDGEWAGYGIIHPMLVMDVLQGAERPEATVLLIPPLPPGLPLLEVMEWYRGELGRHIAAAREVMQTGGME